MKILLMLILLFSCNAMAADFSSYQKSNLKLAYDYGKSKSDKSDTIGYILAAIMWKESGAGIDCGFNGDAVGAFQNRTSTIKARLKQDGIHRSHKQIASDLKNKSVGAKWAYIELSYWLDVHKGNMSKAVASYNAGWKYNNGMKYSASVLQKAKYLEDKGIIE